jgi:hypothetical protein
MLDLYDLIQNIEKRPAMYLGQADLTHLEQQFSEFQAWIEQRFNVSYSQPWEKIIRFFSPDESISFQQFFILFNEFTELQPIPKTASLTH